MKDPSKKRSLSLTLFVASRLIFGAVVIEVFPTWFFLGGAGSLTLVWRNISLIRINRHILRWWGLPASPPKRRGGHLPLPFSSLDPYRDYSWWQVHADGLWGWCPTFKKQVMCKHQPLSTWWLKPSKKIYKVCLQDSLMKCSQPALQILGSNNRSCNFSHVNAHPTIPARQMEKANTGWEGGTGFGCVRFICGPFETRL